jgi:hypothetical protein
VQVSALTSSSARVTWQTNIPTLEQTAFGLDAPTVWTAASSAVRIDHVSDISGLEFSTTVHGLSCMPSTSGTARRRPR